MNNGCQNLNVGDLSKQPIFFRHPENADIGKKMYYENGHCVGTVEGFSQNDHLYERRVIIRENAVNDGYQISYNPNYMYVQINPITGGKSRRSRTKKTRRGKSKRRGRKTRGQRR